MRTTLTGLVVVVALASGAAACNKDKGKAKDAPKADEPAAAPAPAPAPEPAAKPADPAPAPAAEAPAPPAGPRKLGELDGFALMDALKAAGCENPSGGGMEIGAYRSNNVTATKDGAAVTVTYVAPTGKPDDPKASMKATPPPKQAADLKKKGAAVLLKKDVLLAVSIEGKDTKANQALLDAIVKALALAPE